MSDFTIIIDTRERKEWDFASGVNAVNEKLQVGDYSIVELSPKTLAIERKASTSELATNLGKKKKQFDREMEALAEFKYGYIICEFTLSTLMEFPKNSGIPKKLWSKVKMNAGYLYKCLRQYEEMGINIIYCENRIMAQVEALNIFKWVYGEETKNS